MALKQLSFTMTPEVATRLEDLIRAVRLAGHHKPSQRILVEALIWQAGRGRLDGRAIEVEIIAPYRQEIETEEDV